MIKPRFKDPVDELVDSIENLGIKTQKFLRLAGGATDLGFAEEVTGLNSARSRLRNVIRKMFGIEYPPKPVTKKRQPLKKKRKI